MAVDSSGNAFAVWQERDATGRTSVWTNRYDVTTGLWGTATFIGVGDTANTFPPFPQIAVDANGNALVVWRKLRESQPRVRADIWANRYDGATGLWGTAEEIDGDAVDAFNPQVAMDTDGNALAVWQQFDENAHLNIWANRYDVTTGLWGTATLIGTNDARAASSPQIAVDANGHALAVWQQEDTRWEFHVWANRYDATTDLWDTATLISPDSAPSTTPPHPQIGVDANGNALVVWRQQREGKPPDTPSFLADIWANSYDATTGLWGTAELIEMDAAGNALDPRVAVDLGGNAIAVWWQADGIWFNWYTLGPGWGTAQEIEGAAGLFPQVTINVDGNAIAMWYQPVSGGHWGIWTNQYTVGRGWGMPREIEGSAGSGFGDPLLQVTGDPDGNAIAVWTRRDTRGSIRASRRPKQ